MCILSSLPGLIPIGDSCSPGCHPGLPFYRASGTTGEASKMVSFPLMWRGFPTAPPVCRRRALSAD